MITYFKKKDIIGQIFLYTLGTYPWLLPGMTDYK